MALAGGSLVAGCGGDEGAATVTTATVAASSYVSKPPATTTTTIALKDAEPGQRVGQGQEYTIQAGDYPLQIAEMYGVEVEALMNYNEWGDLSEFPYAGTTIRIPPGGIIPQGGPGEPAPPTTPLAGANLVTTTSGAGSTAGSDEADADADGTTDDGGDCSEETYTVDDGDYPLAVAEKFDVDPQALDEANQATPNYSMFYAGLEIVIPAGSDC